MIGVLYILTCILAGSVFCGFFLPKLKSSAHIKRNQGEINLPEVFVLFPAWYLTGTLFVTWITYFVAYGFGQKKTPLTPANAIVMPMVIILCAVYYYFDIRKKNKEELLKNIKNSWKSDSNVYWVFALIVLAFCVAVMFKSFYVDKDNNMCVGYSVWGDFGAHLSMIRSFSYSNNYPTGYTYFAGEDIKYHFMHEFLVGNLEYLGLRIDYAFNIPSILSLFSTYLLLFVLTCNVLKSKLTACLGALFFTFRSSPSVFTFLANDRSGNALKALWENKSYFTYSDYHEGWGFWCTRVFSNQRHLAFGITALLLALIIFLPYLTEMGRKLSETQGNKFRACFFSKDSFAIRDWKLAVGCGLFLGALAFWHGSALIACLSMLFFMAAFSCFRLDYLITAGIAVGMSVLQSKMFITGSAVSPSYFFGFIAENRTVFGVLRYVVLLTGITLLLAVFGMLKTKGIQRYMLWVFFVPFVLSFFLSLTPDIGVNHKWIIMSLMLTSMFTAHFVASLIRQRDVIKLVTAIVLCFVLTATGITELFIQYKEDMNYMRFDQNSEVTLWLKENVDAHEIVLADDYAISEQTLGGIMGYFAYEYCTWSAGYDTNGRKEQLIEMMSSTEPNELAYYAKKLGIDYIIVNVGMRECQYYDFNETLLEDTFEEVYTYGEVVSRELKEAGAMDWSIRIFDTRKHIY